MSEDLLLKYVDALEPSEKKAIDIGANHGMYTDKLLKKFSFVHAIEPHPDNYNKLRGKYTGRNVVVHRLALGKETGTTKLWTNSNPGGHTINENVGEAQKWGHKRDIFLEVEQTTLDEFAKNMDIGLIKCDCEGAEDFIFEHGRQTLLNNDLTLLLETHQTIDCDKLYNLFIECGYSIFESDEKPLSKLVMDRHYIIRK